MFIYNTTYDGERLTVVDVVNRELCKRKTDKISLWLLVVLVGIINDLPFISTDEFLPSPIVEGVVNGDGVDNRPPNRIQS